jgi:hypothetical protein
MQYSPCVSGCKWHKISLMTTRAGFAGILTGLLSTMFIYLLFISQPDAFLQKWSAGSAVRLWFALIVIALMMIAGGGMASLWSRSTQAWRATVLGGLAGSLAGTIIFCLWGAAAAGLSRWVSPLDNATKVSISHVEILNAIIRQTMGAFLVLFGAGSGLGALGGWLSRLRQRDRVEIFDKIKPQMAMNAAITAVPASIVAAALAAYFYSRLSDLLGDQTGQAILNESTAIMPLAVALLLVIISHFALLMVIPHETRQAEHRCGLDEVKMAAYVGIGATPLLILFLSLTNPKALTNPLVLVALLASSVMSLKSLHSLHKLILPRRASFPAPLEGSKKTEAKLFGTIASSHGSRLVVLCIGCGLVMILPLHVSVFSVLINLNHTMVGFPYSPPPAETSWGLFGTQALISTGVVAASITLLVTIYLFYLNLGRWFNKWSSDYKQA